MFLVLLADFERDAGANVKEFAYRVNLAAGRIVIDVADGRCVPHFHETRAPSSSCPR